MAHRGGWLDPADARGENTLRGFRRAVEFGYRYIETDLRITADGELIVFHDASLDRLTEHSGPVGERTWPELAGVLVGGVDPIPRLSDVLEEFPDTRFNLDLKADRAVQPLVDAIRRMKAAERVCVCSFSDERLAAFRRAAPGVPTAVSPTGAAWATHAFGIRRFRREAGDALQIPVRHRRAPLRLARRDVVRLAHATGRVVHVWTIDDETEMNRLLDIGVDGLISNDLATLKRVLDERGLWGEE